MAAVRAGDAGLAEPDRLEGFSAPRKVDRLRLDRRLPSEAFPLRQGEDALATIAVDDDGKAAAASIAQ